MLLITAFVCAVSALVQTATAHPTEPIKFVDPSSAGCGGHTLARLLKANSGRYTFGSACNRPTSNLDSEIDKACAGLAVMHIFY
jgi:hypothetical protein